MHSKTSTPVHLLISHHLNPILTTSPQYSQPLPPDQYPHTLADPNHIFSEYPDSQTCVTSAFFFFPSFPSPFSTNSPPTNKMPSFEIPHQRLRRRQTDEYSRMKPRTRSFTRRALLDIPGRRGINGRHGDFGLFERGDDGGECCSGC